MNWFVRFFYPDLGNSHRASEDLRAFWQRSGGTSAIALSDARDRLEKLVDYHESAGQPPAAVMHRVIQCAAAMPDSPRRQAFARQAAFQPTPRGLRAPECIVTAEAPRLRAVGQAIAAHREALRQQVEQFEALDAGARAALLEACVTWHGPSAPETLDVLRRTVELAVREEDWLEAYDSSCEYMSRGGRLRATDAMVASAARIIEHSGILAGDEALLLPAWGMARTALRILVQDADADVRALAAVRALTQALAERLGPTDGLDAATMMAMGRPSDPALEQLAEHVESLRESAPDVHRLAANQLAQARDTTSSVAAVARTWLANLRRLPSASQPPTAGLDDAARRTRIAEVRLALQGAAYGHEDAKKRILGIVDQRLRLPGAPGTLLALSGPHGNGKTTLVTHGLAPALGLPSHIVDMGGMQDPRQLLGHLPVYVGAEPGKLVEALIALERNDGVLVFDEIEKASREVQDVVANLVDANRNARVETTYFSGIPIDLSRMIFAFTLNDPDRLSPTLRARLSEAMVTTEALSADAKVDIARRFLIPAARRDVGRADLLFDEDALRHIIAEFTQEAGVRQLRGHIFSLARDLSLAITEGCTTHTVSLQRVLASNLRPAPAAPPFGSWTAGLTAVPR